MLFDYAKDVREAVIALVGGNGFSEARRVVEYPTTFLVPASLMTEFRFRSS